jgi:hypothetical protein
MNTTESKAIKPEVKEPEEVQTIAENNRSKIQPYVDKIQEQIFVYLDRAAANGFELKEDMPKDKADQLLTVILQDIMEHYQGTEMVQDRNMFQSLAFGIGACIGYKVELISTVLRKIPLSAHFSAGTKWGECRASSHISSAINKFSSTTEKLKEKTAGIMGSKEQEVTATPQVAAA